MCNYKRDPPDFGVELLYICGDCVSYCGAGVVWDGWVGGDREFVV